MCVRFPETGERDAWHKTKWPQILCRQSRVASSNGSSDYQIILKTNIQFRIGQRSLGNSPWQQFNKSLSGRKRWHLFARLEINVTGASASSSSSALVQQAPSCGSGISKDQGIIFKNCTSICKHTYGCTVESYQTCYCNIHIYICIYNIDYAFTISPYWSLASQLPWLTYQLPLAASFQELCCNCPRAIVKALRL